MIFIAFQPNTKHDFISHRHIGIRYIARYFCLKPHRVYYLFYFIFFYYSFCMEDLRGLKLTHKEHSIDFDLMMILLIKMSITKQSYHHFNCVYVYRRSETLVIFVYFSFCVANMETSIFLCIYNLNVVFFLLPNEIYLKLLDIYVFSFHSRLFERKFVFFSSLKGVCNESVKLYK